MSDFLRLLLDSITYLWPFRIVKSYQRGVYRVNGLPWRPLVFACGFWYEVALFSSTPGLKLVCPFFTECEAFDVQPDPLSLPRQSLTLRDGRSLVCQALMTLVVDDILLAVEEVAGFLTSAQEVSCAKIADKLMTAKAEELEADNRGRLLGGLKQSINNELKKFGCRCVELSFVQFALGSRTYRLFTDTTSVGQFDV